MLVITPVFSKDPNHRFGLGNDTSHLCFECIWANRFGQDDNYWDPMSFTHADQPPLPLFDSQFMRVPTAGPPACLHQYGRGGHDPVSLLRDAVPLRSSIDAARCRPAGQFLC